MASRPCTVLNFTTPCPQFIKSHGRGYSDAGNCPAWMGRSKCNKPWTLKSTQKAIHFQTCYFFWKIVATEKQLLTPVLRFNNCQSTKSGSISRLESVTSSLFVVLMRIFLKETTCIVPLGSWESSGWGGGTGEVKWTLKKDWTGDKNKIGSTA